MNPHDLMNRAVGGTDDPHVCMNRLLAIETPEDAAKIRAALQWDWEKDWSSAFTRAARQVLGPFVSCAGGCGKQEPVYQAAAGGQQCHVGAFICPDCHDRVCGVNTREDLFHECKAKEIL